jgi:hypothetical protein
MVVIERVIKEMQGRNSAWHSGGLITTIIIVAKEKIDACLQLMGKN